MMPMTQTQDSPETEGGIDSIIARVQEYQANPEMVTPETLGELLSELTDLKSFLDGEETEESSQEEPSAMSELMAKHGGVK